MACAPTVSRDAAAPEPSPEDGGTGSIRVVEEEVGRTRASRARRRTLSELDRCGAGPPIPLGDALTPETGPVLLTCTWYIAAVAALGLLGHSFCRQRHRLPGADRE